MEQLEEHLKKWFGYNSFRSSQKEIVTKILSQQDVVAILPTGAGKSICYQLPAMLMPGTAIVVSPLISLMQDQVDFLTKNRILAAYLNSSLSPMEVDLVLSNLNDHKLLYIAPERLADPSFVEKLKGMTISFFVIDEAHCISQWGHSFRPDYRQLFQLKKLFPDKPIMALTATATPEVENDIISQLSFKSPYVIKSSFDRPNLTVRIMRKAEPYTQIKDFLAQHAQKSGIIYASTRKTVDTIHNSLTREGFNLGKYHAGMSEIERRTAQHDFVHDKTQLIVATVAFGMGIHKPDIRFIIHHDMPRTIEQYYQEIGRAGRDSLPAECLMLYNGQDLMIYDLFLKDCKDEIERAHMESKTAAMYRLCQSLACRRKILLKYFGEETPYECCHSCDNCLDDEEKLDGSIIAQKILSCVYRLNQRFGIKYVIDILRGSKSAQILKNGHDRLSTYNIMREYPESEIRYYIDSLMMMGFLKSSGGEYPILQWTETSQQVIKGLQKVEFRKKIFKEKKHKEVSQHPYNKILFDQLRALRLELARKAELPPFAVFSDRSLYEMATFFPQDDHSFLTINGVGKVKLEQFGNQFLNLIKQFCLEQGTHAPSILITPSANESLALFQKGMSVEEIASARNFSVGTIISHLCKQAETGSPCDLSRIVNQTRQEAIDHIIDQLGVEKLKPIKEALPEDFSYDEIRCVVAMRRSNQACIKSNVS